NASAPASDFTATVVWGDGTSCTLSGASGDIVATGGGSFALLASHTFADDGTRTLAVLLHDAGGARIAGRLSFTVAEAPLSGLSLADPGATEGQPTGAFTVATFHDANALAHAAAFKAVIQWGDGFTTTVSGSAIKALGGGDFAVKAAHTYAEEGSYTL